MTATPHVPSADATRGAHFRATMRSRGTFWWLFTGMATGLLAGAWLRDPLVMAAAPAAWALVVAALAYRMADKRAALDFYGALAPSLGLLYVGSVEVFPMTPLLGAGDRRHFEHVLCSNIEGRLADGERILAHYTYEVAREDSDGRQRGWEPHRFTVFLTDFEPGMTYLRGIYLRRRRGLLESAGHDWLRGRGPIEVELESIAFNEAYELRIVEDQDPHAVRELFSPSLVDWLARHPLKPSFEYRAGTLVVFLPGHVEDAGRLAWFKESAEDLARRLVAEVTERI